MPQTSITRVSTAIKMTRSVLQVPAHLVSKVTINPGSSMVAIMRRAPGTIVIGVLLLTAARGDAHDEPSAAKTTSRPPATSLRETCPMVRASLPRHMQPFARWQRFGDRLDQLAAAGNTETRNALEPLQNAVDGLVAGPATGQETVDAEQKLILELDHLANACTAAGSNALQPKRPRTTCPVSLLHPDGLRVPSLTGTISQGPRIALSSNKMCRFPAQ